MDSLRSLVERARQGDFDAFNQIVRRFQGMAYATAYALLGQPQAAPARRCCTSGRPTPPPRRRPSRPWTPC